MTTDRLKFIITLFFSLPFLFFPSVIAHADDHGDDFTTATSISVGSVTNGVIDNTSDQDFFVFTVSQAEIYVISSRGVTSGATKTCTIFNSLYQTIAISSGGGVNSNFRIDKQLDPGTYYARISGNTGPYYLHIDPPCESSATGLSVSGVVRNSATHLPLSGITVMLPGEMLQCQQSLQCCLHLLCRLVAIHLNLIFSVAHLGLQRGQVKWHSLHLQKLYVPRKLSAHRF